MQTYFGTKPAIIEAITLAIPGITDYSYVGITALTMWGISKGNWSVYISVDEEVYESLRAKSLSMQPKGKRERLLLPGSVIVFKRDQGVVSFDSKSKLPSFKQLCEFPCVKDTLANSEYLTRALDGVKKMQDTGIVITPEVYTFYQTCSYYDRFYDFSDDINVYRSGKAKEEQINATCKADPVMQKVAEYVSKLRS